MPAPIIASGTVALGGSNVTLAAAPSYRALAIKSITLSCTSSTGVHVSITSAQAEASVFDAYVATGQPVLGVDGYHFQPGDVATLVVPAGTGNLAYEVTFEQV